MPTMTWMDALSSHEVTRHGLTTAWYFRPTSRAINCARGMEEDCRSRESVSHDQRRRHRQRSIVRRAGAPPAACRASGRSCHASRPAARRAQRGVRLRNRPVSCRQIARDWHCRCGFRDESRSSTPRQQRRHHGIDAAGYEMPASCRSRARWHASAVPDYLGRKHFANLGSGGRAPWPSCEFVRCASLLQVPKAVQVDLQQLCR